MLQVTRFQVFFFPFFLCHLSDVHNFDSIVSHRKKPEVSSVFVCNSLGVDQEVRANAKTENEDHNEPGPDELVIEINQVNMAMA